MASRTEINIKEPLISYPIWIEDGSLSKIGLFVRNILPKASQAFIVTDELVAPLYLALVEFSLKKANFNVYSEIIRTGETFKTFSTIETLYNKALGCSIKRGDVIIALGGGIVGDITGYFAATFQRGVPLIQVPTTLLAQVDASVGGKTGINWNYFKNLIGAFYHPKGVLIDISVLNTLSKRDFACGMAEVVKYSLIEKTIPDKEYTPSLFSLLQQFSLIGNVKMEMIIERCCQMKADVVEIDPYERSGIREILNLGHTFAHAYETLSNGEILHGEAVSIGIVKAFRIAELMCQISSDFTSAVKALLHRFNLPIEVPTAFLPEDLVQTMQMDKKMFENKNIRLVLPYDTLGKVRVHDNIPVDLLRSV